jgi:hypothetical protein
MLNLSDKEIDRLSREAADSYEPDDSSLTWSRLEQKLIQQMPERPPDGFRFGRINPYVWGPAIVLLAGASFFFIKNIIYSQHSTRNNQTINRPVSSSATDDKQAGRNTIHLDSVSSAAGTAVTKNKKFATSNQAVAYADANPKNKKEASSRTIQLLTEARYAETVPGAHANKTSGSISKNSSVFRNTASGNNRTGRKGSGSKAINPGSALAAGSIVSNHSNTKTGLYRDEINGYTALTGTDDIGNQRNKNQIGLPFIVKSGAELGNVSGNDSLMNQLARSKTPIHQKTLHLNRSLNVGFVFGPDYTNAGGIANNQIGNNIGISVGYYLTSKLSINTGIIYSNKFYWSKAHNYFFPQPVNITPTAYARTFAAPPPIDYINGAGNIWELPLTFRYDFAQHNKTKFFANAGLSSYFIMKQTYIYFLHSLQSPLAYKITDNQQVNYWFGIADISVGFEAEIGKGFSFQAEPFLKLPLQNMGMENLKLTSYGFLLSFKYAPVLSRSKK